MATDQPSRPSDETKADPAGAFARLLALFDTDHILERIQDRDRRRLTGHNA